MTDSPSKPLEALANPPLIEVGAGFYFESLEDLEPAARALFWNEIRDRYPNRELRPAIEQGAIVIRRGPPLTRTWFVSETGEMLVQIQHDRFVLNWRSVGPGYPRFSSAGGVRDRAMEEFSLLQTFSETVLRAPLRLHAVEVLKVDLLLEGTHFSGDSDLQRMFPLLSSVFEDAPFTSTSELALRFAEDTDAGSKRVALETVAGPGSPRTLKLETIARLPATEESTRASLDEANSRVNGIFSWLIPENQRDTRFQGG